MHFLIWVLDLVLTILVIWWLARWEAGMGRCRECGKACRDGFCGEECTRIWTARRMVVRAEVERRMEASMPEELRDWINSAPDELAERIWKWAESSDPYEDLIGCVATSHQELAGRLDAKPEGS